jgi:hypothetical protein
VIEDGGVRNGIEPQTCGVIEFFAGMAYPASGFDYSCRGAKRPKIVPFVFVDAGRLVLEEFNTLRNGR